MGSMSASDAAPLPRLGEVFFDVRGESRTMRLSWYADNGVAVFSIWQGGTCTGTFRLPIADLPRMVEALRRGPHGHDDQGTGGQPGAREPRPPAAPAPPRRGAPPARGPRAAGPGRALTARTARPGHRDRADQRRRPCSAGRAGADRLPGRAGPDGVPGRAGPDGLPGRAGNAWLPGRAGNARLPG